MTTLTCQPPTIDRALGAPFCHRLRVLAGSILILGLLGACGGGAEPSGDIAQAATEGTAKALSAPNEDKRAKLPAAPVAGTAPSPAGYYVNAESGSDSNPGTVDQPWKTLARLKGVLLGPGEGIYLRCGQTWRESLILGKTELADNSVIAGYGPDCNSRKAVISGADVVAGQWQVTNGIWSIALPAGTPKITQLFVNQQVLHTARWPNVVNASGRTGQAGNSEFATATINQGVQLRALDEENLSARNLAGATIHLRTKPWLVESRTVAVQTGATVRLDKPTSWDVHPGQDILLEDQLWMLDSPGEFFHDVQSQRLHVMAPASDVPIDLREALVEGSVRDLALAVTERSGIKIHDIEVRSARLDGLRMTDTPQAQIHRVEAHHNQSAGIRLWQWVPLPQAALGQAGPVVADSLLTGNGQAGIDAQYVERSHIRNIVVRDTGTGLQHTTNVYAAILAGPGGVVEDNEVNGSGYIGIRFSAVGGSKILRNDVLRYCLRLTDCGAIYTWNGNAYPSASTDSLVQSNRIAGAAPLDVVAAVDGSDVIAAVYVDDRSDGVTVHGNAIFGAPTGVLVHNASRTVVTDNRIWLPSRAGIFATMDNRTVDTMIANRFEGNQIVPLVKSTGLAGALPRIEIAQAFWFWHWRDGTAALGAGRNSFVNNTVFQLQGHVAAHAWVRGPGDERYIDALQWQALNPAEPAVQRPLTFDALKVQTGPELVQNGTFEAGLAAWRSWQHPSSSQFIARPHVSRLGCEGRCVEFTSGHAGDLLASEPFSMKPGVPYVYRWRAVMPSHGSASVAWPYISRENSPWDAMWNAQGFVGSTPRQASANDVLNYEIFFIPKSSDPARVNLQLDTLGSPVAIDNVSVREVTAYVAAQVSDWAAVAYAPAAVPRTWSCIDLGWPEGCRVANEAGQDIALPVTVPARGAQFLVRTDSSFVSRR